MESELKNLPAAERIKRLKELADQKKKEIEEAQNLMKESEAELGDQITFKQKVPIAQVAKEDLKDVSLEEKEIIKIHRGIRESKEVEEPTTPPAAEQKTKAQLEELVADATGAEQQQVNALYQAAQSIPIKDIYKEMTSIYKVVEEKGYINQYELSRVEYLSTRVEAKQQAADAGHYSMTEELERRAGFTKYIGEKLRNMYKSSKWND